MNFLHSIIERIKDIIFLIYVVGIIKIHNLNEKFQNWLKS